MYPLLAISCLFDMVVTEKRFAFLHTLHQSSMVAFNTYFLLSHRSRWILASFRSESPLQAFQDQDFKSCGFPEQLRLLTGENRIASITVG